MTIEETIEEVGRLLEAVNEAVARVGNPTSPREKANYWFLIGRLDALVEANDLLCGKRRP